MLREPSCWGVEREGGRFYFEHYGQTSLKLLHTVVVCHKTLR